jgi:hypothetical protein
MPPGLSEYQPGKPRHLQDKTRPKVKQLMDSLCVCVRVRVSVETQSHYVVQAGPELMPPLLLPPLD